MNDKPIRTRIAPSPTGLFHIGTARTALFNYLFAKKNNGEFLVRIEDTDKARSKPEYEDDILNGLKWLGLNWDEEIVRQSDQAQKHLDAAMQLRNKGFAYEKDGAIWFKIPENDVITFKDMVRGEVSFHTKDLEDFVIVRSDGSPIFYLVGIIDDFDMGITHVIRGEDLLSNTPKQILIARALGYTEMIYAHLPLILSPTGGKLSKRKDATSISDYKKQGYLLEGLVNFMALLGWHPKDDREFFTLEELVNEFSMDRVSKGGAVFDVEKLNNINKHYIQESKDFNNEVAKLYPELKALENFDKIAVLAQGRVSKMGDVKTVFDELVDIPDYSSDQLVFKKSDKETALKVLRLFVDNLSLVAQFGSIESSQELIQHFIKENELSNGDVFWPVRVALSGSERSAPPTEYMWVLGKEESIRRINLAIEKLKG